MKISSRSFASALLGIACSALPANAAVTQADILMKKVSGHQTIAVRRQKDHRVGLFPDSYATEQSVQVHLTLTDKTEPYTLTLGWFGFASGRGSELLLDELGQSIPLPGGKVEGRGVGKADLLAAQAFDHFSEGQLLTARAQFEAAVKAVRNSPRLHNNLGVCLALNGELQRALKEFDQAINLKTDYAVAFANRALAHLAAGNLEQALSDAQESIELKGDHYPAFVTLCRSYIALKRPHEAQAVASAMLSRWGTESVVLLAAGDAASADGDLNAAKACYSRAAAIHPDNATAQVKLAKTTAMLGDFDEAKRKMRHISSAVPDSAEAHLQLGQMLEVDKEFRAAQLQYERALELNPPAKVKMSIYGPLLRVLLTTGQYAAAEKLSKQWASVNPGSAACQYNRAWVISQLPNKERYFTEAIESYKRAAALDSGMIDAHYNLALLYMKRGQQKWAADELRQYLRKAPDDASAQHARNLLAKLSQPL